MVTYRQASADSLSPIVDCGVHYVDIMCQMTRARPIRVHAIGARLTGEISAAMYNYGQLQVMFDDGSVGWYEAGWGPMMSETAYFVKDVIGPQGLREHCRRRRAPPALRTLTSTPKPAGCAFTSAKRTRRATSPGKMRSSTYWTSRGTRNSATASRPIFSRPSARTWT